MSKPTRFTLLILGIALLLLAAIAILYTIWPVELQRASDIVPAVIFSQPTGLP